MVLNAAGCGCFYRATLSAIDLQRVLSELHPSALEQRLFVEGLCAHLGLDLGLNFNQKKQEDKLI